MVSRHYSEEIGLSTRPRIVPVPYVVAILAAIVAMGWYGFSTMRPVGREASKTTSVTSVTPVPTAPVKG